MRDNDPSVGVSKAGPVGASDLSFAAFVLTHAGCEDATVELRLGEDLLLEWCPMCAALDVFGASGGRAPGTIPRGGD